MSTTRVGAEQLRAFAEEALRRTGVRGDVARFVADGLLQASVRGVDSHGIRLLPHYVAGVRGGRINPQPAYGFRRTAAATGLLDADHTFGHAAGMEAARHAQTLAGEAGAGFVAVRNSSHFGAAAYFALEIARHDMIGLSFSNTDALIRTHAGVRPFLGNNPLCVAAPCEGEEPFCLDMATSAVTFNKIRQWREADARVPAGVAADRDGRDTDDPHAVASLLPIGAHKGYGLSLAIEILCSVLTGMPYGPHIPKMFEAPMRERRRLAHVVAAIRVDAFEEPARFKRRLAELLQELRREPRADPRAPIQVAGDPEKRCAEERLRQGIPLGPVELEQLNALAGACGLDPVGQAREAAPR
jgi:LDH2 family malate/lactate/ureidoglycolate dehydrogenase